MATDAASLLAQVNCHACYAGGNTQLLRLMRLSLIKQWALLVNPAIDTSPEALLEYAKCHACYTAGVSDPYLLELFVLVLIDQALQAEGGGGQDQGRITEEEVFRDTEEGERRFTEEL